MDDGRLHHKRIDAELAKAMHNSNKRREAANARWMQMHSVSNANASDLQDVSISKQHDPRARSPSPSPRKKESGSLRSPVERDDEFQAFWKAYPRKSEGPAKCRKAFEKAKKAATFDVIMSGLQRYPFKPDFIPMPSTWLNDERWLTEPDTPPPTVVLNCGKDTALAQFGRLIDGLDDGPQFDLPRLT